MYTNSVHLLQDTKYSIPIKTNDFRSTLHCVGKIFSLIFRRFMIGHCYGYGVKRHFQQYFSYIVTSALLEEENGVTGEKH